MSDHSAHTLPPIAHLYLKTIVSVTVNASMVPAGDAARALGGDLHVITAWNPGDARPSLAHNRAQNDLLRAELSRAGVKQFAALGEDPNSDHFEESIAVIGMTDDEARTVGRKFDQVAVFKITPTTQTVIACNEEWEISRSITPQ